MTPHTEDMTKALDYLVAADGLHWRVVEIGEGPTILLVHGTAASIHSWRNVMLLLSATHHVVAVDLPGHGGTKANSSRDYTLERMGRGIVALCAEINVTPDVVAGHSAGAAILARVCGTRELNPRKYVSFNGAFYPFAGVSGSLFSPIAKMLVFNPLLPRILSTVASRNTVERLLRNTGSNLNSDGVDQYFKLFKNSSHVAAGLGMMAAWDLGGMENSLARMRCDCVFVAGMSDQAVAPEIADRAAKCCRNAKVLYIDGYGHLLHEENPILTADIIRKQTYD
jgi:magnesium chelatase accessory protein